jgi:hypothetical protein
MDLSPLFSEITTGAKIPFLARDKAVEGPDATSLQSRNPGGYCTEKLFDLNRSKYGRLHRYKKAQELTYRNRLPQDWGLAADGKQS